MKKLIACLLSSILVFFAVGCSDTATDENTSTQKGTLLLLDGNVKKISVTSLPEGYDYSFEGEDSKAIVDYLSVLNLVSQFKENPNEYGGMTWVISLEYDNGETLQIYHFANMFIKAADGKWYRMNNDEAINLENLLDELTK